MYEYLNTYLKRDLFSSYLKDADFDVLEIEQLQNTNSFLDSVIERMQQRISQNNRVIENYGIDREKGYSKVHKK